MLLIVQLWNFKCEKMHQREPWTLPIVVFFNHSFVHVIALSQKEIVILNWISSMQLSLIERFPLWIYLNFVSINKRRFCQKVWFFKPVRYICGSMCIKANEPWNKMYENVPLEFYIFSRKLKMMWMIFVAVLVLPSLLFSVLFTFLLCDAVLACIFFVCFDSVLYVAF